MRIRCLAPEGKFETFKWNDFSFLHEKNVTQPGVYWVEVADENGCKSSDTIFVQTMTCPPRAVYVPNAFTPNNDNINDVFKPSVYGKLKSYRFSVFDRYGTLFFTTNDYRKGWNGKVNGRNANPGVLIWTCWYELDSSGAKMDKGSVVVIR